MNRTAGSGAAELDGLLYRRPRRRGVANGGSDWTFQDPNGVINTANLNQAGNTALGGIGGFQAGYNWQFAPAWVAGIRGRLLMGVALRSPHGPTTRFRWRLSTLSIPPYR